MTAQELQKLIEGARAPYKPGVPMDAATDQDILVGLLDGLGGDKPTSNDRPAWSDGIRIGNSLRKLLAEGTAVMEWHAYQYLRRKILVAELRIDTIRAYIRDEEGIIKWATKETEETKFKREARIKQLKRNEARYIKFLERKYVVLDGQMRLRGFQPNGAGYIPIKDFT